jgi:signal transduction histidine kinase
MSGFNPGSEAPRWGIAIARKGRMTIQESSARNSARILTLFELAVVLPTVLGLVLAVTREDATAVAADLLPLFGWILTIALVELIPVPMWRGTTISMGFPLLMVVAFLYQPPAAAAAAFLAASDPREIRREIGLLRALFNRCQVALAVGASSAVFHAFATVDTSPPLELFAAAALAAVVDYVVNSTLVCLAASIHFWMNPLRVIRQLRVGRLSEFVVSYLGLAVFGVILARIFSIPAVGFWAVPVIVLPLLLARQMFFRSKALEEAHKELQDREHILRALSNRMAEERQDERLQIAAFLHDDLAQLLFRLSIQVDVARKHLDAGRVDEAEEMLAEIRETKNKTSDRIRALIRDLHRSPLGRAGLAEAIQGFLAEIARESEVQLHADVAEVDVPAPIALLLYHNAREAVMNALRHAQASNIWIAVEQEGDEVEMVVRDDGAGFDTSAPGPEGHYGMTMMRERAAVASGTLDVLSAPGEGTTITVRFPTSWLQEGTPDQPEPSAPPLVDAAHDTAPNPPNSATESVPA